MCCYDKEGGNEISEAEIDNLSITVVGKGELYLADIANKEELKISFYDFYALNSLLCRQQHALMDFWF
ncbi:hypothetical protein JGT96_07140 [Enterobacter hormaechei]|uniref:hypothetical protein n=1 Tax=Enterobacter hormaechei TaxID=158836 RepID=UPI0018EBF609|nr:hypothetical protein [Enterobacter hormaechei]MBJ6428963.1 hypothetical protein [Enterobacter hormaechei]MBJ6590411.1 hypothetical protein [Enterobacter hormaechei]MBK4245170.1 hypothetical protein [Enterobacter hormaechei]MBK4310745.1 hypothetical protein [Enterobacter hormaechei]MBK4327161.1 hypothetical protein [Enterobacter hormaechei]